MTTYFIRRFLLIIPTLLGVTMIGFLITRMVPGGPLEREILAIQMGGAQGGGEAGGGGSARGGSGEISEELIEHLKKEFRLDMPWYKAYVLWLGDLVRLDLGKSWEYDTPVTTQIKNRLPISITFGLCGFFMAYLVSIPLGIFKAIRHGGYFDFISSAVVFLGYSVPGWALGTLLLVVFAGGQFYEVFPLGTVKSFKFDQLPESVQNAEDYKKVHNKDGEFVWENLSVRSKMIDSVWHMFLPVMCYMMGSFASLTILTKNSLMDNLGQDYVRTAYAKGLSSRRVIFVHTLRNSLIPLATGLGHILGLIMAGSYLIEYVFEIEGVGKLGFESIQNRDYPVVLGILTINTLLVLIGNIISDILYAIIDPRIRFE